MICETRDKADLADFLRQSIELHFYALGDLDDFFWPHTRWFVADEGELEAVALLYTGGSLPALLALSEEPLDVMRDVLREIGPLLPDRLYVHLTPGLESTLEQTHALEPHGDFLKMVRPMFLGGVEAANARVVWLTEADLPDIMELYRAAYPHTWFEPFMLATGCYAGIRDGERLVAISGVHVVSKEYRVAALGNIATHPDYRGRGLARTATAAVCAKLAPDTDWIGLNVNAANDAAITCYERLGFVRMAEYREYMAVRRATSPPAS